jgi:hypothetical protein
MKDPICTRAQRRARGLLALLMACTVVVGVVGAAAAAPSNILNPGETLAVGGGRSDGSATLVMQADGNLVASFGGTPFWWTGTSGANNTAVMQTDGNLVVYSAPPAHKALWQSGTNGFNGAFAAIQSDKNFVVYTSNHTPVFAYTGVTPQAYAQAIMFRYSWDASQWQYLNQVFAWESHWQWNAYNPVACDKSNDHAYGIPQSCPGSKMAAENATDWSTSPFTQVRWGMDYIQQNYHTPYGAYLKEKSCSHAPPCGY